MKKRFLTSLLVVTLAMSGATSAMASTNLRVAEKSRVEKSWVGIPVYKIGVKGDYKTDGKRITGQSNARCNNSTYYPGWSCTSKKAKWVSKGSKSSIVRNNSTFFYGLNTQWITIGIQSYDEEINATVRP